MTDRRTITIASILVGVVSGAEAAWPERPVTLIVPWAAGGGTDAIARVIANGLEKELGMPVPVVNRTGAGGIIGHSEIVNAAPDGYTIGLATAEITTYWWAGTAQFTYEDVTPIALVNFDAAAFNVAASSPWQDLDQALGAITEAPPGTYKLSGTPAGAAYHLAFAGLLQLRAIDPKAVTVIPSQGAAPGFQELAAGGVQIVPSSLPEAQAMVQAGRVRSLAVMAPDRLAAFPEVPTVEQALGEPWVGGTWRGLAAPAGLPDAIAARLVAAALTVHESEAFRSFMAQRGFGVDWAPGAEFADFMAEQHVRNGAAMKALGLAQRE
jgi:tripartite-type tricarboxylate transporter receptor subunit TctC